MNAENGYKITRYLHNVRVCNPFDELDLQRCMCKLRRLHSQRLQVKHTFDILRILDFTIHCGMLRIPCTRTMKRQQIRSFH